jgi:hypothetical protein
MDKEALLRANAAFYDCFAEGDTERMITLWSTRHPIACAHPGWPILLGREAVLESWRRILADPPRVVVETPHAFDHGVFGIVLCVERIGRNALATTNVFVPEFDGLRLIHHQSGPIGRGVRSTGQRKTVH